jgi:hypothetical protein
MFESVFSNHFGSHVADIYKMPPKRCERVGCNELATVVAVAGNGNWYMCDACASQPGVRVEVRLIPHTADAACAPAGDVDGTSRATADV